MFAKEKLIGYFCERILGSFKIGRRPRFDSICSVEQRKERQLSYVGGGRGDEKEYFIGDILIFFEINSY